VSQNSDNIIRVHNNILKSSIELITMNIAFIFVCFFVLFLFFKQIERDDYKVSCYTMKPAKQQLREQQAHHQLAHQTRQKLN